MQSDKPLKGYIIISDDIENEVLKIEKEVSPFRCVKFVEESFKIEHAKMVLGEAYISESQTKYLILAATEFTDVAQNSLLKLLEEPPKNIEFIIISPTKSNLLPTVRSRLPILKIDTKHTLVNFDLNLARVDYKHIFTFLKENSRIKKQEAKELVQAIFYRATVTDMLILSQKQLDNFDKAYRLIDLNSRPQSVLAMLIMSFAEVR